MGKTPVELLETDRAFSIHYTARSGSMLLVSLFDNHPQILHLTSPNITQSLTHFFEFYTKNTWPDVDKQVNRLSSIFEVDIGHGLNSDETSLLMEHFRQELYPLLKRVMSQKKPSLKHVLNACWISFQKAKGKSTDLINPIVFFNLHEVNTVLLEKLRNEYSSFIAISTIREPLNSIDSQLYHHLYETPVEQEAYTEYILKDYLRNVFELSPPAFGIKLEDLHRRPKHILAQLCQILDIEWVETLLEPTYGGKPHWFLTRNRKLYGLNPSFENPVKTVVLSLYDIIKLKYLSRGMFDEWRYSKLKITWKDRFLKRHAFKKPFSTSEKGLLWRKDLSEAEIKKILEDECLRISDLFCKKRTHSIKLVT